MQEQELKENKTEERTVLKDLPVGNKESILKNRYIEEIAIKVYQTEELLVEAVNYCKRDGNQQVSMEEYVRRHFGVLLSKFSDLAESYRKEVKDRQVQLKKARRKINKKANRV